MDIHKIADINRLANEWLADVVDFMSEKLDKGEDPSFSLNLGSDDEALTIQVRLMHVPGCFVRKQQGIEIAQDPPDMEMRPMEPVDDEMRLVEAGDFDDGDCGRH